MSEYKTQSLQQHSVPDQSLSEHGLIAAYFAPLADAGGLGLLDDAALMRPKPGHELVMTVDAVVSGVHFLPDDNPRDIAWKALAVNVSDLAAKGADPKGFLLTLGLNEQWQPEWMAAFADELGKASKLWRCPLYGGDTVRANGAAFMSITAFGEVPQGKMVQRRGAMLGDVICVSGTIGDSALGLHYALGEEPGWAETHDTAMRAFLLDRYHRPQPRLALAGIVRDHATAAMDISDGLIGDLKKLLAVSGVGAEIDLAEVPLSAAGQVALGWDVNCLKTIVTGGDDYEILCTVPALQFDLVQQKSKVAGGALTAIGRVLPSESGLACLFENQKIEFSQGAFSHF